MDLKRKIQDDFGITSDYIKVDENGQVLCIVHSKWLNQLQTENYVPEKFIQHETLSGAESQFLLLQNNASISHPWQLINIQVLNKQKGNIRKLAKMSPRASSSSTDLSYSQLIHYVTETNYRNLWKQAWKKYQSLNYGPKHKLPEYQSYNEAVREIIKRLYHCPLIKSNKDSDTKTDPSYCSIALISSTPEEIVHPNLVQMLCAVETDTVFYLIYHKPGYSFQDCLMFSPAIVEISTTRSLFVIYQLLQVLRAIHNHGLYMGIITLSDIAVKQNLWIQVMPCIWSDIWHDSENECSHAETNICHQCYISADEDSCNSKNQALSSNGKVICQNEYFEIKNIPNSLVMSWVQGSLSNYDYLMELNKLAGRIMDNPKCHPVMPWIMDFTVPEGGWRDLSKSKYRLNKGDKQLDLTYESATSSFSNSTCVNYAVLLQDSAIEVPHHISEVLSDITYYVYKSRRMMKTTLCQHVRQKWVPAEYPSTIQRLQEWTPDECIPEFFSDPSIFYSIHPDLNDLGIPWWCENPEDFIKKHRAALESDHVSERLHHWIDITFGYKLSGNAAVKSKNVCLPLVDQHTAIKNYGMVQLFTQPHPHKLSASLYYGSTAPKTFRSILQKIQDIRDSGDEETSSESSNKSGRWKVLRSKSMPACPDQPRADTRPENQTIVLPKDYSPLAALTQLESLGSFMAQCKDCKVLLKGEMKSSPETNGMHAHHRRSRDMLVLGCLIGEISFNSHLKAMPKNASLDERYSVLLHLFKNNKHEVPRCFQQVIQLLLQLTPSFAQDTSIVKKAQLQMLPDQYPPVSASGLPPPSAHQLLQPLVHTIPFPEYFSELYSFLEQLNKHSQLLESVTTADTPWLPKQKLIAKLANSKVHYAAQRLLSLLPMLNAEGIELIIPYIQEMFENPHTSLLSSWHLFNVVAQSLGPQQTAQKLLVNLTKLFDTDVPSSKHMKLYHRSFLLQLIVRLGLNTFLAHFMTLLIEAIGGFRDYLPGDTYNTHIDSETPDTVSIRKGSHLQSPELQQLVQESDFRKALEGTATTSETTSSPYDEDSSNTDPACHPENESEKESEIFYLEIAREYPQKDEKEKIIEQSHHPDCLPSLLVQDDDKWRTDDEADEQLDEPEIDVSLPLCDSHNKDDDNFSCEKLKPPQSTSIYSHSAPNLPSHLSNWPKSESSEDNSVVEDVGNFSNNRNQTGVEKGTGTSNKINQKLAQGFNISDVSSESVLWLAHRLGPVLTAKYLTRNLLRMLTLCYHGLEQREMYALSDAVDSKSSLSITGRCINGDKNASKVLDCLSRVAALYGEQFIMLQYLPHIADLLVLCKRRLTETLEAGLLGAMALLHHIIPYLSDVTLMDHLQDVIIKDILYSVVRLVSSLRLTFPGGGQSRWIVTCRLIDIIYLIGLRIGFEMTRKHLSNLIQRFFSCFDKVYDRNSKVKNSLDVPNIVTPGNSPLKERAFEEIRLAFTPEIAYLSYISFCKLAGGIHMEQTLKNDELIRKLCVLHDMHMAHTTPGEQSADDLVSRNPTAEKSHHRVPSLGQDDSFVSGVFGKNVIVVGNRLDVHLGEESHILTTISEPLSSSYSSSGTKLTEGPKYDITLLKRKMNNSQRHLKGNWLAYWEHEIGRSEKDQHFNFKQIKLQSFVGHTGSVRTIHVLDNENSFLTSSKDKTVKLWSLRSCGDGSTQTPCQWTYTQHRKSVFAVSFLDSLRLVGSCDSTVHIWDPFMGSCIKQFESTKGSPVTFLTSMPAPSTIFLAATTSSTVRFLDARTCRYMHEFKVSIGPAGLIRCLAVSPNGHWLAVGHSTGMISVLDVRTGLLYGTWMGHEGEILQLKAFNNSYFVTSSLDHSLSVWNAEDSQAKCNLKGPLEPVTCLSFYKGEVISGTTANRIGLHTAIDSKAAYSSTRLRSDTFKGVLTSMSLLPLNRLLLLGADNGSVVLLS